PSDQSFFKQHCRRDLLRAFQPIEIAQIDHRPFDSKDIRKSPLRHTPLQRHLPPFKSWTFAAPRPCEQALMSLRRRFSVPRADAASDAFAPFPGIRRRLQVMELHWATFSTLTM